MMAKFDIMMPLRRTVIQLDGETHAALRKLAYEQGRSMASVVRETLSRALVVKRAGGRRRHLKDYPFLGSGSSRQGGGPAISEEHDEAIADALRDYAEEVPRRKPRRR